MAKTRLGQQFELQTRDRYTKVDCDISLSVDGRELPNMAVLGTALEEAVELIRNHVIDSYKVVPERDAFTDKQPVGTTPTPIAAVAPQPQTAVGEQKPAFVDPRNTQ